MCVTRVQDVGDLHLFSLLALLYDTLVGSCVYVCVCVYLCARRSMHGYTHIIYTCVCVCVYTHTHRRKRMYGVCVCHDACTKIRMVLMPLIVLMPLSIHASIHTCLYSCMPLSIHASIHIQTHKEHGCKRVISLGHHLTCHCIRNHIRYVCVNVRVMIPPSSSKLSSCRHT